MASLSSRDQRRRVLLIGSSGGGTATLGHSNPDTLVAALDKQLQHVGTGASVAEALFVSCTSPLDGASPEVPAALWTLTQDGSGLQCILRGSLADVNTRARELDKVLASKVQSFDGVVAISTDCGPTGVNRAVMTAVGKAGLPVAGTGGSSLSVAAGDLGCRLAGNAGGSVATTPQTKAIGIAASLAAAWGDGFAPAVGGQGGSWHSSLDGCLPAFLAAACVRASLKALPLPPEWQPVAARAHEALGQRVLPPAIGAIAAQQATDLGELAVLGGAVVGALSEGSVLAALGGSWAFSWAAPQLLAACARMAIPATATTLAVAGGLSTAVGLCAQALAPATSRATLLLRCALAFLLDGRCGEKFAPKLGLPGLLSPGAVAARGALAGFLMNYGSRRGWYHQIFLPLILVEMEHGEMSLLGTLDWLTLCMTGAGACAAQLLCPRNSTTGCKEGDAALARRGLVINFGMGDYIEACFPFLARDRWLDAAVYAASAVSGAMVALAGARSTAYVAAPVAIGLGSTWKPLTAAATVAFTLPLAVGITSNLASRFHK